MIRNKRISLVLPCRNEEIALQAVLRNVPKEVDEIIVVDNLSKDKTVEVAADFGAKVFIETRIDRGIGYGFALAKGINEAFGEVVVCMDGDGSYPVKKIPVIVKFLINEKADFISCNRLPVRDPKKRSAVRAFGVNVLNFFIWLLFGFRIKDSLTGMWVFNKNLVKDLKLFEGGWNFSEEIKLEVLTNPKIKFLEYDIPYQDRIFNQSKLNIFQAGFSYLLYLFRFKFFSRNQSLKNTKLSLIVVEQF